MGYAHDADEEDLWFVAVADTPADKVGMKAATEIGFDHFVHLREC